MVNEPVGAGAPAGGKAPSRRSWRAARVAGHRVLDADGRRWIRRRDERARSVPRTRRGPSRG